MLKTILESLHLIIALCMGIFVFRYLNPFQRIFFFQLLSSSIVFIWGNVINFISNTYSLHLSNHWLYNLYMPIEAGLLVFAAFEYFRTNRWKYLIGLGYVAFLSAFITEISINGLNTFSNHGYIAESALLLLLFLLVLYIHFTKGDNDWKSSPTTWISLGIVLYFGGAVPYLSFMQYLQISHPKINLFLFYFIIEGLANVRYLLLALGFWFVRRNVLSKIHGING